LGKASLYVPAFGGFVRSIVLVVEGPSALLGKDETMKASKMVAVAAILLAAGGAMADISIETVPVGNAGNTGELSGTAAGGWGQDRICGAVDYDFNIGKYEVTAGQYTAFLTAVAGVDTYALYNTSMANTSYGSGISRSGSGIVGNPYTYSVADDFTNRPVNHVNWGDAARFANWLTNGQPTGTLTGNPVQDAGLTEDGSYSLNGAIIDADLMAVVVPSAVQRATWSTGEKPYFLLTSEDEWYKAAYYNPSTSSYYDYPTGSNTAPGRDMADASGNNANYYGTPGPIDSPYCTTLAGEFQNSDSPYGTFDQGGNVWEWNESILYGSYRGLRGGSFGYCDFDSYLHAADRIYNDPSYGSGDFGFRVSEVPEPASMALLALGGLAVMRGRSVGSGASKRRSKW